MVYVMQADALGGRVKIGSTTDVERRRETLERALNAKLRVVATLPGDVAQEHRLHCAFSRFRDARGIPAAAAPTEWFTPDPKLFDFIAALREDPNLWELLDRKKLAAEVLTVDFFPDDSAVQMWSGQRFYSKSEREFFIAAVHIPPGVLTVYCSAWGRTTVCIDSPSILHPTTWLLHRGERRDLRLPLEGSGKGLTEVSCAWHYLPETFETWRRPRENPLPWWFTHRVTLHAIQPYEPQRPLHGPRPRTEDGADVRGAPEPDGTAGDGG